MDTWRARMSSTSLTALIGLTGTSYGGLYDVMALCGSRLSQPNFTADSDACMASFRTTVTHAGQDLSYFAEDFGEDSLKRTLGSLLLWRIPSEGLNEAIEALIENLT